MGLGWVGFELGLEWVWVGLARFRLLGFAFRDWDWIGLGWVASAVSVLRFAILEFCSSSVCFGSVLFASAVSVLRFAILEFCSSMVCFDVRFCLSRLLF